MLRTPTTHRVKLELTRRDALAILIIAVAYSTFFAIDTRSSEFLYAVGIGTQDKDFDQLESFSVDDYFAPWRYRLLPRLLQWGLAQGLDLVVQVPFLWVAMGASCLFMVVALSEFYLMLRMLGLPIIWAMFGWLLANTTFPVVFGYRGLNYMTLDDTLAFALTMAALLAILTRRYAWFVLFSVLAALTRETTLILAFLVLLERSQAWRRRIALVMPALLAALAIRLALWDNSMMTADSGLPMVTIDFNLHSEGLVLTTAYVFAVFGVGWLLGLLGWVFLFNCRRSLSREQHLLWMSAPFVVGALVAFSLFFAVVRENRVLFLVFPWVVGLGAVFVYERVRPALRWEQLRLMALFGLLVITPPIAFLLIVPGGQGLRLATLSRVPGYLFLYHDIWAPFRERFSWIPGQLAHVLLNLALSAAFVAWLLVSHTPPRTKPATEMHES